MKVRFWGVRGSIPVPGPSTVRYGGNTSCLEVLGKGGELVILEAGSGIRPLGLDLMRRGPLPHVHLFISHTHWDHIQGFPFFVPAYIRGTRIDVRGPVHFVEEKPLADAFAVQMRYEFFPVSTLELAADIRYEAIKETSFQVGGITIQTQFTNHPIRSLGYRLTEAGRSFVYTGDHEPYYNLFEGDGGGEDDPLFGGVDSTVDDANARFVDFVRGAEIFVCDAQYTPAEYPARYRNWGHSSWDYCLGWMAEAGARRMVLTHHDPNRADAAIDEILAEVRKAAAARDLDPESIQAAREGLEMEV